MIRLMGIWRSSTKGVEPDRCEVSCP
jgi:hypothetical protein